MQELFISLLLVPLLLMRLSITNRLYFTHHTGGMAGTGKPRLATAEPRPPKTPTGLDSTVWFPLLWVVFPLIRLTRCFRPKKFYQTILFDKDVSVFSLLFRSYLPLPQRNALFLRFILASVLICLHAFIFYEDCKRLSKTSLDFFLFFS